MSQTVRFYNGKTYLTIEDILAVVGLQGIPITHSTSKGYKQNGVTVHGSTYEARPFSIKFDIKGKTYAEMLAKRRAILKFFAPKGPKTFLYDRTEDNIHVYMTEVRLAGTPPETGLNERRCLTVVLQFIAADPYLKRNIPFTSAVLETPLLEYPPDGLEYLAEGVEYSICQTAIKKVNSGDDTSPAIIRIVGPANTPWVQSDNTGQKIEINRTILSGQMIEINSETGKVEVVDEDGTRHNAFNYIEGKVDFIDLELGENILSFGSAGGSMGYIQAGGVEYFTGI